MELTEEGVVTLIDVIHRALASVPPGLAADPAARAGTAAAFVGPRQ